METLNLTPNTNGTPMSSRQNDSEQNQQENQQEIVPEMPQARMRFTSKMAVIRHVLLDLPEDQHLTGVEIAEKCEALVRKLPPDMQAKLLPINDNLVYQARKDLKMRAEKQGTPAPVPPQTKQKKIPVSWTEMELNQLTNKVVDLRMFDGETTLLDLVRQAQKEVLPAHRQRTIFNSGDVKALLPKIKTRMGVMRDLIERGRTPLPPMPAPTPAPVPVPTPAPTPAPELPSLEEILMDLSDETLLFALRERNISLSTLLPQMIHSLLEHWNQRWQITDHLLSLMKSHEEKMDSILDYLTKPQPPLVPKQALPEIRTPAPLPEAKGRKPRYMVFNLYSKQQERLEQALGHLVDLRFVDKNEKTPTIGPSIDKVVLFTRFCDHSTVSFAEARIAKENILLIGGGIEEGINFISRSVKGLPIPHWNRPK